MATVRRIYIYLVCAIALQGVTWTVITLFRSLLIPRLRAPIAGIALEISAILVGLPIYLIHWIWSEKLARRDNDERASEVRHIYLYGMMVGFLTPFLVQAYGLTATILGLRGQAAMVPANLNPSQAVLFHLLPMVFLVALWVYHYSVLRGDQQAVEVSGSLALIQRLYVLSYSVAGLGITTLAIIRIVRWVLFQIGSRAREFGGVVVNLKAEVARLLVGVPLWLVFWLWAQRLYHGPSQEERESAIRKFYLYGAVFVGVMSTVTNLTIMLAGLFRMLLGLASQGDIRIPISNLVGAVLLWVYHAFVLREDASKEGVDLRVAVGRQAAVRRLYLYLVAAVGLATLLVGLAGDISVLLLPMESGFGQNLREMLAWFTSAILAGLPVWLIPWRSLQGVAVEDGPRGIDERQSLTRKIYLYFYVFVGTMTVLSTLIFILSRLITALLNGEIGDTQSLRVTIASGLIGVGVLVYHSLLLRGDTLHSRKDQAKGLIVTRVVLFGLADPRLVNQIQGSLVKKYPGVQVNTLELIEQEDKTSRLPDDAPDQLAGAGAIVAPADLLLPVDLGGGGNAEIMQALSASPAYKLLVPVWKERWGWIGVERFTGDALLKQTLHALDLVIAGKPARASRTTLIVVIVLVVLFVVCALPTVASLLLAFFTWGFY